MKRTTITLLITLIAFISNGQTFLKIGEFDRVVISPHINVVFTESDESSVKIEALRVDERDIHVEVSNDVLSIYLEGARYYEKYDRYHENGRRWKEDVYQDAEVTAYINYIELESIQVRGSEEVIFNSPLQARDFKATLYGEVELTFGQVQFDELIISMFGDNWITADSGMVDDLIIRCYGNNDLELMKLECDDVRTNLFGDNDLELNARGEIRVTSFGDSDIDFIGNAFVSRGIIIGDTDIDRVDSEFY